MQFSDPKIQEKYEAMKSGGKMLSEIIHEASKLCLPGTPSAQVDSFCYKAIKDQGCEPAFLGFQGFPASLVFCLNNEVVHGIPSDEKIIKNGDLVTLDLGLIHDGYVVDMALSLVAGDQKNIEAQQLIDSTRFALDEVIKIIRPGFHTGGIGFFIENIAKKNNHHVIYECAGHGVGVSVHEPPVIANYGNLGEGPALEVGQSIAIEPIMSIGTNHTNILSDGWTMVTDDDSLAAQSEHTVIVTESGCEILTQ